MRDNRQKTEIIFKRRIFQSVVLLLIAIKTGQGYRVQFWNREGKNIEEKS